MFKKRDKGTMTEAEIQQKTEKAMREIGNAIAECLQALAGHKMGFALIVFEFNKPGVSNYISNAERTTMIKGLKETVEKLKLNQDIPASIGPVQ